MLKTTKKLRLNREQLRVLTDTDLERSRGGYVRTTASGWCSSDNVKCTNGCLNGASTRCVNR
jgi:hypothetical protein